MRAIIVDDEQLMLKRFVRLSAELADLQIVGRFTSAQEALQFAKQQPIELAFLDVEMPEMDGIALAQKLRGSTLISSSFSCPPMKTICGIPTALAGTIIC